MTIDEYDEMVDQAIDDYICNQEHERLCKHMEESGW